MAGSGISNPSQVFQGGTWDFGFNLELGLDL